MSSEDIKILIIDDEEDVCDMYVETLSDEPINGRSLSFEQCHDGSDGLNKLHEYQPDILILDLMMPGLHGAQVYKKMEQNESLKDTKTIILSGNIDEHPISDSENLIFMSKPVRIDRLRRVISMLMSKEP